jgi:hypothetical protein
VTEEADEGERLTPGRGDEPHCEIEFDLEGGYPDEADEEEKADVRLVNGVEIENSHGEEEALDEVTDEENDPREECSESARFRAMRAISFPGMIRVTWPDPINLRPRTARVKSSGKPWSRDSRVCRRSKSSSLAFVAWS